MTREPTVEDVHQLMGASTPHFALQIRNRIRDADRRACRTTIRPAWLGEREIARLERLAEGSERRGDAGPGRAPTMPSLADRPAV